MSKTDEKDIEYDVTLRSRVSNVFQLKFKIAGHNENLAKKKALKKAAEQMADFPNPDQWEVVAITPVRQMRLF